MNLEMSESQYRYCSLKLLQSRIFIFIQTILNRLKYVRVDSFIYICIPIIHFNVYITIIQKYRCIIQYITNAVQCTYTINMG